MPIEIGLKVRLATLPGSQAIKRDYKYTMEAYTTFYLIHAKCVWLLIKINYNSLGP